MTLRVGIIADDLTSAADGAAPFRRVGLSARIVLGSNLGDEADVVAVDTDTRRMAAAAAGATTAGAARSVRHATLLFKTVDSTLRGHLAGELIAALTASGRATAILAPAFPAEGRTTADGVQLLNGAPIHHTGFSDDLTHPVTVSDLQELVPGAQLWAPGDPVPPGIAIADAASDADLDRVVDAVDAIEDVLWVGSPGIAAALARRLGPGNSRPPVRPVASRVLAVVGSQNPTSRRQLDALIPVERIVDAGLPDATTLLAQHLSTEGVAGVVDRTSRSTPEASSVRLAGVVARLDASDQFDALLATGGATARAILDELRIQSFDLLSEPEPGVVIGLVHVRHHTFPMVVKAGGFGDIGTLTRLHQLLTRTEPQELP